MKTTFLFYYNKGDWTYLKCSTNIVNERSFVCQGVILLFLRPTQYNISDILTIRKGSEYTHCKYKGKFLIT